MAPYPTWISERPAEVADRAVPGHWEGDLILGTGKTCIGTLVERSTRYLMLMKLEKNSAEQVRTAMVRKIQTLPAALRRSVTWDRGKEMTDHLRFTVDTGVRVYFCDPSSAVPTGTPMVSHASTSPREPTSPSTRSLTSMRSPSSSMNALDKPSTG
ncbi:MAG: IS30 family transposase [Candidatus Dormibacteraceae bacterium]